MLHPNLHYQQSDGPGPCLLLLHAFPLSSEMWRDQLRRFEGERHLLAPDMPGFGRSPLYPGVTIEGMGDAVIRLLDHLAIPSVVPCGISMGGYVAQYLAVQYPDRVCGAILSNTRARGDTAEERTRREGTLRMVREGGISPLIRTMLPLLLSEDAKEGLVVRVRAMMEAASDEAVCAALEALIARPTPSLGAIADLPVLLIAGAHDTITPPPLVEEIGASLRHAKLVVIGDAGHLPPIETELAFNEAADAFLQHNGW